MQPTGKLHIGNYTGALKSWAENQSRYESLFCVADMHAITTPETIHPMRLGEKTLNAVALYMACGIDPDKSVIFLQSHVPEHGVLAWILNCSTPVGWLYRMTQFKAKSSEAESVGTGLLNYPVLMAADILLYDTDVVPVGEDQKQHIELTRDIAKRFNHLFHASLKIPEPLTPDRGARIMALDNPMVKMSKSTGETVSGHSIGLLDPPDQIRQAILGAKTDSGNDVRFSTAHPGVKNLLGLYDIFSGESRVRIENEFRGKGYGHLKERLSDVVIEALRPIRERHGKIMADRKEIHAVLATGAERARSIAIPMMDRIRSWVGFVPLPENPRWG